MKSKGSMTPRRYTLGRRAQAAERTRGRILKAAAGLLAPRAKAQEFSLDAVARRAGVARMTVYYQFGSKGGLLEALFDSFAAGGKIGQLIGAAFQRSDPLDALDQLVAAFAAFFEKSRAPIRRVRAMAVLDPELERAVAGRDARRREAMRAVTARLAAAGKLRSDPTDAVVDALSVLTGFELFDALAGKRKTFHDVVPMVQRLCRAAVGAR
jgi:AcrR family transcriptional regulator